MLSARCVNRVCHTFAVKTLTANNTVGRLAFYARPEEHPSTYTGERLLCEAALSIHQHIAAAHYAVFSLMWWSMVCYDEMNETPSAATLGSLPSVARFSFVRLHHHHWPLTSCLSVPILQVRSHIFPQGSGCLSIIHVC